MRRERKSLEIPSSPSLFRSLFSSSRAGKMWESIVRANSDHWSGLLKCHMGGGGLRMNREGRKRGGGGILFFDGQGARWQGRSVGRNPNREWLIERKKIKPTTCTISPRIPCVFFLKKSNKFQMSRGAEPCFGQALPAVLHALARQRRRQRRRRRPLHLRGNIEGLRAKVVAGEQQAVYPAKWSFRHIQLFFRSAWASRCGCRRCPYRCLPGQRACSSSLFSSSVINCTLTISSH